MVRQPRLPESIRWVRTCRYIVSFDIDYMGAANTICADVGLVGEGMGLQTMY